MMLEIATTMGKIMQETQEKNCKPLWELDPIDLEELKHAVREQETPIQT